MTVQAIGKTATMTQSIYQALASLLAAWLDFGASDIIIRQNGQPVAVLIPYQDYQMLVKEDVLVDLREGREAAVLYEEWLQDRSTGIPYTEIRAELVTEGVLDE
jgi:PHD/YefM family antitoxin component YafN of YafNO toxin-antitoxin module